MGAIINNIKTALPFSPPLIFLDFETVTLRSPDGWDDPISLYMIKTDIDLNILDEIKIRFKHTGQWSIESEKVHRISESEANSYPDQAVGLEKIKQFCGHDCTMVFHAQKVGHYFDYGIMLALFFKQDQEKEFYRYFIKCYSTVNLLQKAVRAGKYPAQKRRSKDGKLRPSYKLDVWAKFFGIELNHHDARSDAMACYEIFKRVTTSEQSGKTPSHSQKTMSLL